MGAKNYLIEGISGTGKTSVCNELLRRGHHSIHGDRELAYQGDPITGKQRAGFSHENHIWNVDKVRALMNDHSHAATFFCGGSRNWNVFVGLFDLVFVLKVDSDTLSRRLTSRSENEWGGRQSEKDFILKLHASKNGLSKSDFSINAARPIEDIAEDILQRCSLALDVR